MRNAGIVSRSQSMRKIANILSKTSQRWRYRPADYREERGELVLLVWGDIPYWTVIDKEFESLLQALDGKRSLQEIIDTQPDWQAQQQQIREHVRLLRDAGVFAPSPSPPKAQPPFYGTKIESVAINITRRCNLRCRFCYNLPYLTSSNANELQIAEIVAFLQQLRPFLSKHPILTLLGGEPLLDTEKLLEVAEHALRQSFTVLVSTNGMRVTDDFAQRAAKLGMQVQVSLDGHTAALHDAVRGTGAFAGAVAGVRTLVRHKVHTIISMVCHQGNLAYLEDFYRFAGELGVNEARFIPLKCLGGAIQGEFSPVPLDKLLCHAFDIFSRRPEFLSLTGRDAFAIMANTCRYSSRRASCGTGLQTLLLDADGALYPCLNTNHPDFHIADIRHPDFNFSHIWRASPRLLELRRSTVIYHAGHEHEACPVRYWCLGGCRGENKSLTGSLNKRPPHCAELQRGIIAMFWMLAERPDLVRPSVKVC